MCRHVQRGPARSRRSHPLPRPALPPAPRGEVSFLLGASSPSNSSRTPPTAPLSFFRTPSGDFRRRANSGAGGGDGPSTGAPAVAPGGGGRGGGAAGRRGLGAPGLKFQRCAPVVFNISKSVTAPPPPPRLSSFLKLHHLSVLGGRTFRNCKAKDLGTVEVFVFYCSYIQWVFLG